MNMHTKILGLLLGFLFFFVGLLTVSDYGINWDEPVHYIRGQAFLRFFMTGKKDYTGVPRIALHYPKLGNSEFLKNVEFKDDSVFRRSFYQYDSQGTNYMSFNEFVDSPGSHPPLNGELASLSNFIFYQQLGWLGDVESYHLFIILVSSVLVFSIFLFAATEYGVFAGLIAFLSLVFYPLFFSESHFNIKDPVEASFYGMTILLFYKGITQNKKKLILLSAVTAGLALGTKFNILFAFPTLIPWLIVLKWNKIKKFQWPFSWGMTLSLFSLLILPLLIFFATNPNLWSDPIKKLMLVIAFYKGIGSIVYQPANYILFGFLNTYSLQWMLFTTPVIILILSLFGIVYAIKNFSKEKNKTSFLILLWFLIPILRVSFFHTGIYGGLRQIMEFIPAMALLAGIGANYIVLFSHNLFTQNFKKLNVPFIKPILTVQVLIIILFVPIFLKIISIHPNENVYFNSLIGGLSGASERNFADWGTTLGSVYRQGINWINKNAEKDAKLALVNGYMSNIPIIWIREDIGFNEKYYSGSSKKGEYIMEVTDYSWMILTPSDKQLYLNSLTPVHQIIVDDVPILKIWKNTK